MHKEHRRERRDHRARVRRAAAGGRVRRGRPRRRSASTSTAARSRRSRPGAATSRTSRPSGSRAVGERMHATTRYAALAQVDAVVIARADAAEREPRARPPAAHVRRHRARERAPGGPARRARVDHLPGHHARAARAAARGVGPAGRRDFNLAFSPERIDPGRTDFTLRTTPKVVGGLTPSLPGARERALRQVCDEVVPVSTLEVAELTKLLENIFRLGQHRARQRDRDALRPDGHRHLGGRRGGRHQALRLHVLQARPRHGRPLPAGRPVLPLVEGARVRLEDRVHRAGGRDQPEMPYFCAEKIAGALNEDGKAVSGSKIAHPRRLLQGRRRGHARVARDQDHAPAGRPRGGAGLPRPLRAGAARLRPGARSRSTRCSTPTSWRSSRCTPTSTPSGWLPRRSSSSTSAGSPADSAPGASCGSRRPKETVGGPRWIPYGCEAPT